MCLKYFLYCPVFNFWMRAAIDLTNSLEERLIFYLPNLWQWAMFGNCMSRHAIASLAMQLRSDHPPGVSMSRKKWAIDFFVTLKLYPTERKKSWIYPNYPNSRRAYYFTPAIFSAWINCILRMRETNWVHLIKLKLPKTSFQL